MSERNDLTNSPPEHTRTALPGREDIGPKPRGRIIPVSAGNAVSLQDSDEHSKLAGSHLAMEERARQLQMKLGVTELLRQTANNVESGALPVPIGRPPTAAADDSRAAIVPLVKRAKRGTSSRKVAEYLAENGFRRPPIRVVESETGVRRSTIQHTPAWKRYRKLCAEDQSRRDFSELRDFIDRDATLRALIDSQQEDETNDRDTANRARRRR